MSDDKLIDEIILKYRDVCNGPIHLKIALREYASRADAPKDIPDIDDWRSAALRVGEMLCASGPPDYYNMTPRTFLHWATSVKADAPKADPFEPSADEMRQAQSITEAINAQVDSEFAPKDAPDGHSWVDANAIVKWSHCALCGVIKLKNGRNGMCKGATKIALREAKDAPVEAELLRECRKYVTERHLHTEAYLHGEKISEEKCDRCDLRDRIDDALSRPSPEPGCVVPVPVEPTEEMIKAGIRNYNLEKASHETTLSGQ